MIGSADTESVADIPRSIGLHHAEGESLGSPHAQTWQTPGKQIDHKKSRWRRSQVGGIRIKGVPDLNEAGRVAAIVCHGKDISNGFALGHTGNIR